MGNQQIIFLVAILFAVKCVRSDPPQVEIEQGILTGTTLNSRNGRQFYAFTGIPYAEPPIGKLRFKPPVAGKPWKGILDASQPHAVCPQIDHVVDNETVIGNEDCLFLNVYTPKLSTIDNALLPVMFYIHGGWFSTGSANINYHGPKYLLDKDIVLVTANYRLGPFGFASTADLSIAPNNGLRDQLTAIQWVKKNIASFGGNPEGITLFGHSSGATSAHFHMLSKRSRGLISGVIAQSGSALQFTSILPYFHAVMETKILAGSADCPTYDHTIREMVKCLKKLDTAEIIKKVGILKHWDMEPLISFGPILDSLIPEAFLTHDPIDTILNGKAADIPVMFGLTTHEGSIRAAEIFAKPDVLEKLNSDFGDYGSALLGITNVAMVKHRSSSGMKAKKFYFGNKSIDESTKSNFIKMYSDAVFLNGIDAAVELHAKYSKKPVYYYLFGYQGSASMCSLYDSTSDYNYGVCHGDDLLYLFDSSKWPALTPTENDEKMIESMVTLWTNFATYGNPTPEDDTVLFDKWEPVHEDQKNYYYIKNHTDMKVNTGLYNKRVEFWKNLPLNSRQDTIREGKKVKDEL